MTHGTSVRAEAPFVGREPAVAELDRAFRLTVTGQPSTVTVEGEPGVGKTRLLSEMRRRWEGQADQVAVAASPGVKPPLRIVRKLLDGLPAPDDRVGAAQAEIDRLRAAGRTEGSEPGAVVAYEAIDALLERARSGPLVVLVDDLQWVDPASRLTLTTLAREAAAIGHGVALLVVAVVREEGPDGDVVAELARIPGHRSVHLHPLAEEETDALIRAHGVSRPTRTLVRSLLDFSGGNPLFLREAILRADQEQRWRERANGTDADLPLGWLGPPGDLAGTVARRTEALGPEVQLTLEYAALARGPVVPAVLQQAVDDDVDVGAALERAAAAGLVVPVEQGWTFTHGALRQAIAAGLNRGRRARMHQDLADALAALPERSEHDLLEAARHRARTDPDTIGRGQFDDLVEAGRICLDHTAWGDAAEMLTTADRALAHLGVSEIDRAWLDYRRGRALYHDQRAEEARRCLERACDEGRRLGDTRLEALALGAIARQVHSHESEALFDLLARLDDALDRLAGSSPDALHLERWRIQLLLFLGRIDEASAAARRARHLADEVGTTADVTGAASDTAMTFLAEGRPGEALAALAPLGEVTGDDAGLIEARQALALLMGGRLSEAAAVAEDAGLAFGRTRMRWGQSLAEAILVNVAALRGDVAEAHRRAERCRYFMSIHPYMLSGLIMYPALAELTWWTGDRAGARGLLDEWDQSGSWDPGVLAPVFDAREGVGDPATVGRRVDDLLRDRRPTLLTLAFAAPLAEAARHTLAAELGPPLAAAVGAAGDDDFHLSPGCLRLRAAIQAELHLLAGDADAAVGHTRAALDRARVMGADLEEARCHLDLGANPALPSASQAEHLNEAVRLAERLGLWPILEAATRRLEDLRPVTSATGSDAPYRVVMITDLVGSTAVSAEQGDQVYLEAIDAHHRLVRRELAQHGAHEFDTTGDGIIAWFDEPGRAGACALAIVDEARARAGDRDRPLELRVGLAGGRPLERDGYLYGATLNLAARLCAEAGPNEVVTDDDVRRHSASAGSYESLGPLTLKGFPEPVVAHRLASP